MVKKSLGATEEHFGEVNDPRKDRTKDHKLIDIIVSEICAVICGAEGWVDVENYIGKSKKKRRKTFLELPNGIASHDTFGRVFSLLDAQEFQAAFYRWVLAVNEITQGQIIDVDGKCMLGSEDKTLGKRAIYMVSAWAEANQLVLGQRKVEEKSNETTAIPELLNSLRFPVVLSRLMPGVGERIRNTNQYCQNDHRSGGGLCSECQGEPGTPVRIYFNLIFRGSSPEFQVRFLRA